MTPAGTGIAGCRLVFSNGGPSTSTTDANGVFNVTGLTNRTYNIVEVHGPAGVWAATQLLNIRVSGATTVPNVVLQPGALVSGIFVGPAGPIVGGNINVYDLHGNKQFTPNDATSATGAFAVTAPIGPAIVRCVPPVGSGLIPIDTQVTFTQGVAVNLGTVTSRRGVVVTGTVVDATSGVPMAGVSVATVDTLTGVEVAQIAPNTNAFGQFSLLLPSAFYRLELTAPAISPHVPTRVYGQAILGGRNLGILRMERAVAVSGSVLGPTGPVASADLDVYTPAGDKLWTPGDTTDAAGNFTMLLPVGSYRFTAQPPVGSGLAGASTGLLPISLPGSIGAIAVQPGVALQVQVQGPSGPAVGANLNLLDPITGQHAVLVGDHADATGLIRAVVPPGTWAVAVLGPQGGLGADVTLPAQPILAATQLVVPLPMKSAVVDLRGFGIQSCANGGEVPFAVSLANPGAASVPMLLEVCVHLSIGTDAPVFPLIPLELPGGLALASPLCFLPVGILPTTELGKLLRYTARLRSASDNSVLDQASVEFAAY